MFPAATRYYTQYKGTRCALPLLADAYGLYYNKALFKAGRASRARRRRSRSSTADAKKLTQQNTDGSLKVVGFDPIIGFYENVARALDHVVRRQVARREGQLDPRARIPPGRSG